MTLKKESVGLGNDLEECLAAILASSNFQVADYLNTALGMEPQPDEDNNRNLQQSMAELALQLQIQTQSCHEEIARIGAELQAVLPRCSADVGRVQLHLQGLRDDTHNLLTAVAETTTSTNEASTASLETLSTLHALQANLTRTHEILAAAATWDQTLASIAPLLSSSSIAEAVETLAVLEKGERALRGMPGHEERTNEIHRVRNQVSSILMPQLQNALAISHSRLGPLQSCVILFQKLQESDKLIAEYVKHRPTNVHKAWFEYTPPVPTDTNTAVIDFSNWLPGWLDAVLTLISEERRQCNTIFGNERTPEILLKILHECFRPLLPSFNSRLQSLASSDPSPASRHGDLSKIADIYEALLQFLSLAYESIIGGWLDGVESPSSSQGPKLYLETMNIFTAIASPFQDYQVNLPDLELRSLGEQLQELSKKIQQATSTVQGSNTSLEVLQQATDQLIQLSTQIFPATELTLAHFELLNGGYSATRILKVLDEVLASYASELTVSVHKLRTALTTNPKELAERFDEPHALCALQVLKISGRFSRNMRTLESKTRERLLWLVSRIQAQVVREKEVQDAKSKATSGGKITYQLADSLSAVEIDSLLTKATCGSQDDFEAAFSSLQRLANGNVHVALIYASSSEASKRLAQSCHAFVYEVCSAVPRLHLQSMSSMNTWRETASDEGLGYGTLPQEYITHVGEHMLALVQALEPFASDKDALSLANEVMDEVRQVAQQPWLDFISASGAVGSESLLVALMTGKGLTEFVVGAVPEEEDETETDDGDESKAITAFCNAWLDVVGLAVTGQLLERIMRIPFITAKGCEHLKADLGYLVNVFSALGISNHPHPLLGHIAELAIADRELLLEHMNSLDRNNEITSFLSLVEGRIAAMREIN
jgi:hypothetical protein